MFLQDSSNTLTEGAYGKGSFVLHILYRIMSLCDTSLNGSLWVCLMELWKHLILGEEEREYNYFIFEGWLSIFCFDLQNTTRNSCAQERIEKRIEPWIRRELEAILGDPDPSVIVHVASSLFISSFEEKREVSCEQSDLVDNYLEPLRPFLHERTNMFWHELRYVICVQLTQDSLLDN